jgi:hypothetical protein
MRFTAAAFVLSCALVCWSGAASAYQTFCRTGSNGSKILRVVVPLEKRQSFIDFLQSQESPLALGAHYVGGAESDRRLSICFLEVPKEGKEPRIDICAENMKPSGVFDFSFKICNTTISWRPYFEATRARVSSLGYVSVSDVAAK